MSGHNKWSTIKNKKAVVDAKKGKIFTRLGRLITIAAREGGGDMDSNFNLRMMVEKAKKSNMPKENVDKAIKRGTGEIEGAQIENLVYEAFGPGGVAFIVDTLTDNRNRTVAEIKHIFVKNGGNLGEPNSVMWMFERKGVIRISKENLKDRADEIEMLAIEAGAEDIDNQAEGLTIYTSADSFVKVKQVLEATKLELDSEEIEYVPKTTIAVDDKIANALERIGEQLDDHDDVSDYSTNQA
ncbi:MAG: YebC/PmpR family DNA-binding transcriptional regulator [Patescibacteria group bacterium]